MVFNRRKIDELEDFSDFDDDKLETSLDDLDSIEGPTTSQFSWRRPLLLKAIGNVRKLQESKLDINQPYTKGELLFDDKSNKFGRVEESKKGFLSLTLLSGGKSVLQDEMVEIKPKTIPTKLVAIKPSAKAASKQPMMTPKAVVKAKSKVVITSAKKPIQPIQKVKNTISIKKKVKANVIESFAKFLPKGATTDPIRDPNGYIQQNFMLLNNKELAKATGLSEHTIRRKLGEWGLKRKE